MTSYLSSLTSHYNSIKRLLPTHLSPDSDNTISDPADSHVSRVLRAYYAEKGRPFPPWLGPDPNAPVKAQPSYVSQSSRSNPASAASSLRASRTGGGLDNLFDDRPSSASSQQEEPLSLRSRRGAVKSPAPQQQPLPPPPPQKPVARPLPSQKAGSHQRSSESTSSNYSVPPAKEQTAQERLRARLGGSRGASPASTPSPNSTYDDPMSRSRGGSSSANPYDSGGSSGSFNPYEGSGGSFNPYEGGGGGSGGGGFNPYDTSSRNPYQSSGGGSSGSGGGSRPYVGSSSPWTAGDDGDLGSGVGRRGPGLPSNPRRR